MDVAWAEAQLRVRKQMDEWWTRGASDYGERPWGGGHDHGTFAASWIEHLRLTGNPHLREFLTRLRGSCLQWAPGAFTHGYWPRQEAHHGPEHFIIFLARMWRMDPADAETAAALDDAAEHTGNWAHGVPHWYDYNRSRFISWSLGTEVVGEEARFAYQSPEHFKVLQMALVAHLATGNRRYLDLASGYADFWAGHILEGAIPAVLFPVNDPEQIERRYGERLGAERRLARPDVLERHVAAWSIDTFLDLFELVGERRYLDVARVMLEGLVRHVGDPYADPVAPLFSRYRRLSGDRGFDAALLLAIPASHARQDPARSNTMVFDDGPAPHPMGLGRRRDAPRWGYRDPDGGLFEETGPSPAALMLRFELTGDEAAATRAFELAAARMGLALAAGLGHGWNHGCAGNTVHAVAFGHGRMPGAGAVMATLYPATVGASRFCSTERHWLSYELDDGTAGLPEACAALLRVELTGDASLLLVNKSDSRIGLQIRPGGPEVKLRAPGVNGEGLPQQRDDSFRLLLEREEQACIEMHLARRGQQPGMEG